MRRIAVVTGGGSGIGRSTASLLARRGCVVAVVDRDEAGANAAAEDLVRSGGEARAYVLDVSDHGAVDRTFEAVARDLGAVGILVNNAGIGDDVPPGRAEKFHSVYTRRFEAWRSGEALEFTPRLGDERWQRMLDVNLSSVFYCCRAVLSAMQEARWGRIVNVSSVVALMGSLGSPHYAASKAGVLGLTRSLALEVAPCGVTVNAVCPGLIETPMAGLLPPAASQWFLGRVPMHRAGAADEVAAAIGWFVSEEASYVTGQTLCVDGGAVM